MDNKSNVSCLCNKKNNETIDNNKNLNNDEIDKLKRYFDDNIQSYYNDLFSRKYYNLFIKKLEFEPCIRDINDAYYLGVYYERKQNYDLMKKYYIQAIEKGENYAMYNLGLFYNNREHNPDLMKKYYLMAIDKGNTLAMRCLGKYYVFDEPNDDLMKKYMLMAIDKGDCRAMDYLATYYEKKNYDLAVKYYLMGVDKGDKLSMYFLGRYYESKQNYDQMKKYYLMAFDNGEYFAGCLLGSYYKDIEKNYDLMKKYYLQATDKGDFCGAWSLLIYYCSKLPNNKELKNYLFKIANKRLFLDVIGELYKGWLDECSKKYPEGCQFIKYRIMCFICKYIKIISSNDAYCLFCYTHIIFEHIEKLKDQHKLKNINHFVEYIANLYYTNIRSDKRLKAKKKEICIKSILRFCNNQLFMEYLDLHYYKYLERKYEPGSKKYKKIKKHFELIAKKQNNKR